MSRLVEVAREDGWLQAIIRAAGSAKRNLRDGFTARKLGAPGFHVGRNPRLLGLSHMCIGRGFVAGDDLWLEAVLRYNGQTFSPKLILGDNVSGSDRIHIACLNSITIGDGTLMGSRVLISDHGHGIYRGADQSSPATQPTLRPLHSPAPVVIGRNVWIGDGVGILAGSSIGDGAVIGAGSIVNGPIDAGTLAVGSPARAVRRWNEGRAEWLPIASDSAR